MLNNFIEYLSGQPIALIAFSMIVLIIVYFIVKKLLKLALIFGLVLIALFGFYYYKAPGEFPGDVKGTMQSVREKTGEIVEKGKTVYQKGKEIAGEVFDGEDTKAE